MYAIKLDWKPFKTHLPSLEAWLRGSAGTEYVGNSADQNGFTCWFKKDPGKKVKMTIQAHWDALTAEAEELKIEHEKKLQRAEKAASDNLPYLEFDKMNVAEKKMFMGKPLTPEDRESLAKKYPEA